MLSMIMKSSVGQWQTAGLTNKLWDSNPGVNNWINGFSTLRNLAMCLSNCKQTNHLNDIEPCVLRSTTNTGLRMGGSISQSTWHSDMLNEICEAIEFTNEIIISVQIWRRWFTTVYVISGWYRKDIVIPKAMCTSYFVSIGIWNAMKIIFTIYAF